MASISQRASNMISILLFSTLLFIFAFTLGHLKSVFTDKEDAPHHSFVGKDYPMNLPLSLPLVETVFEESSEYTIIGAEARKAWRSIHPTGRGYVHLGPRQRVFALAMFHQLHCMVAFHTVLSDPEDPTYSAEHVHHCLNYVRQLILCNADQTLEPYDFMTQNFTTDPAGYTRQCRDWGKLYDYVNVNHVEWMGFVRSNFTDPEPHSTWWADKLGLTD